MRNRYKHLAVGSMLLLGAAACADLDVVNPNEANADRALETAADVEALIGGAYNAWYTGNHSWNGAGPFLSNASFQHTAPWANFAMEKYGRIPRIPIINDVADGDYEQFSRDFTFAYRAAAAVADGFRAFDKDPEIAQDLGEERVSRARAFGRFVQGLAHAQIALLYNEGWVIDENVDFFEAGEPMGHAELMEVAMGFMDDAISLASQGSFEIPSGWMQRDVDSDEFIRFAHSMKARYRALNARTPAEREAVDWAQVIADVDAGITEDFVVFADDNAGWGSAVWFYNAPGWAEVPYFIWGMADQSGRYQNWLDLSLSRKHPIINGEPTLIITPDQRFPQGETVKAQQENPGMYFASPADIASVWAQPGRGTWRWSYYRHTKHIDYVDAGAVGDLPEITVRELRLLKAEGLLRMDDRAGAAAIINETRVANGGLNPTDAAGTNTSCVPKLPNGECGDLLEMLKWEKRTETAMYGPVTVGFYFDSRGWGDLYRGTPLQFPVPCEDVEILGRLPCITFGGIEGEMASPGSTYGWPSE